jgi:hypothetical protein
MDAQGEHHTTPHGNQVLSCYHPGDGGFGASPRHDSHLLSTLSAVQILALLGELQRVDADAVAACESDGMGGGRAVDTQTHTHRAVLPRLYCAH